MSERLPAARPAVTVVGGGYGGIVVAQALDEVADVTLIEARDTFLHNIAILRAMADPSWIPRIYLPYDGLLKHGTVVKDRAVSVDPGTVTTESGNRYHSDFVVISTGSAYRFPIKPHHPKAAEAQAELLVSHDALARARDVLLLGGGPVGVELAGEVLHHWPDKHVMVMDSAPHIMAGPYSAGLRAELERHLQEMGADLVLGTTLQQLPASDPGVSAPFSAVTTDGREVTADVWFKCFGAIPNSGCLGEALAAARLPNGLIEVGPTLQVEGHETVFALGDVTTAGEKLGFAAMGQGAVVAGSIRAIVDGGEPLVYESEGMRVVVPCGPVRGAGQYPDGTFYGSEQAAEKKGRDMMIGRFEAIFGLGAAAPNIALASGFRRG